MKILKAVYLLYIFAITSNFLVFAQQPFADPAAEPTPVVDSAESPDNFAPVQQPELAPEVQPQPQFVPTPAQVPVAPGQVLAVPQPLPVVSLDKPPQIPSLIPQPSILQPPAMQQSQQVQEKAEPDFIKESQESYPADAIDLVKDIPDDGSGNWWEKRRAFKSAKPKYEEARNLLGLIDDASRPFFVKIKDYEKLVEQFYTTSGLEQGTAIADLDNLIANLEKEKQSKPQGITDEQLKELTIANEKKHKDIELLKQKFERIKKINENIRDSILMMLADQVRMAKSFENQSIQSFHRISETLDDRKARSLLNDMHTYVENMQAILNWISSDLNNYVDKSIDTSKELMAQISSEITNLKNQGLFISKKLKEQEDLALQVKLKKDAQELEKKLIEETIKANKSIFTEIKELLWRIYIATKDFFGDLFSKISSYFSRSSKDSKTSGGTDRQGP